MGSDIDGRQIRGKGHKLYQTLILAAMSNSNAKTSTTARPISKQENKRRFKRKEALVMDNASRSIQDNVAQYGLDGNVLDNIVSDFSHHPWRQSQFFDAIVCDVQLHSYSIIIASMYAIDAPPLL